MKKVWSAWGDRLFFLQTFFPVKLFLLHLRRSHLLLVFWLILVGFYTGWLGENYGFHYLFISPEYLEEVSFWSFGFVGFTLGIFIMAFHINSYIYYSYRFPFLATLSRPLWKFSLNNFVIPFVFYLGLLATIIHFGIQERWPALEFLFRLGGLLLGTFVSVSFIFTYFLGTIRTLEEPAYKFNSGVRTLQNLAKLGRQRSSINRKHPVNYYLKSPFKVRLTRGASHYQKEQLFATIDQHHLSAAFFFLLLILIISGLSLVEPHPFFRIPAGASVFLIFSLYLMVVGAIYSRFKTWTVTVGIVLALGANYLSGLPPFQKSHFAYGMNYQNAPARYDYPVLDSLTEDSIVKRDIREGRQTLEHWRQKQSREKPMLVLLNVSGGGLRSTMWTMRVLQALDSVSDGAFYPKLHLIAGSSGGMLGAAYYRSLHYASRSDSSIEPQAAFHRKRMGRDLLNATSFQLAVSDLFFRLKKVHYQGHEYLADRGYAFDQRLDENTNGHLKMPFSQYREAEEKALMPLLILAPTIVSDGRKLLMSTQGVSYLSFSRPWAGLDQSKIYDGVEYSRLFAEQRADSLSFLTALRLSASFPYVTPLVNLPSKPAIQLIDAGVRDNEGLELSLRYLYHHRQWIKAHTRGVTIVQLKANRADTIPIKEAPRTRLQDLIRPVSGVVKSFSNFQTFSKSLLMQWSHEILDFPLHIERFSLPLGREDVSLSWHLTEEEKRTIDRSISDSTNQRGLKKLKRLLKQP